MCDNVFKKLFQGPNAGSETPNNFINVFSQAAANTVNFGTQLLNSLVGVAANILQVCTIPFHFFLSILCYAKKYKRTKVASLTSLSLNIIPCTVHDFISTKKLNFCHHRQLHQNIHIFLQRKPQHFVKYLLSQKNN